MYLKTINNLLFTSGKLTFLLLWFVTLYICTHIYIYIIYIYVPYDSATWALPGAVFCIHIYIYTPPVENVYGHITWVYKNIYILKHQRRIRRTAVRETGVGATIGSFPETPRTSQHYRIDFKGGPSLGLLNIIQQILVFPSGALLEYKIDFMR